MVETECPACHEMAVALDDDGRSACFMCGFRPGARASRSEIDAEVGTGFGKPNASQFPVELTSTNRTAPRANEAIWTGFLGALSRGIVGRLAPEANGVVGLVFGALAICLGISALRAMQRNSAMTGKGRAVTGIILGSIELIAGGFEVARLLHTT